MNEYLRTESAQSRINEMATFTHRQQDSRPTTA